MLTLEDLNQILDRVAPRVAPVVPGSSCRATLFFVTDQSGSAGSAGSSKKSVALSSATGYTARAYRIHVAMPDRESTRWMTMIAPDCRLAEAKGVAANVFGAERLLDVVKHRPRRSAT
jgi:hypothetical protein